MQCALVCFLVAFLLFLVIGYNIGKFIYAQFCFNLQSLLKHLHHDKSLVTAEGRTMISRSHLSFQSNDFVDFNVMHALKIEVVYKYMCSGGRVMGEARGGSYLFDGCLLP